MKKFLAICVTLTIVALLSLTGLFFLLTDEQPTLAESSIDGLNDAESVTKLLGQIQTSIHDRENSHTIVMTATQLQSLVAFAERAKPQLRAQVDLSRYQTTLLASYHLPESLMSRYLNLQVSVLPGQYLHLQDVIIGSVTIRGDWVLGLAVAVVDWWTQSDIATYASEQVSQVNMSAAQVSVTLQPLSGLLSQLNDLKSGFSIDQDDWLSNRTAEYLRYLAIISVDNKDIYNNTRPSIGIYLSAVMLRAQSTGTESAAKENEAALMALTIFAGHHRFANFIGPVQPDPDRAIRPPHPTVLANRKDLSQHLVISAGLKLLSEQGITNAIGEFKELMDRVLGGSGYSFVDLAADLAGVKLAQMAIDERFAETIQQRLAATQDESQFFPSIDGLPEGLSKAEFVSEYGDVHSENYQHQITIIQQRINELPLYNNVL